MKQRAFTLIELLVVVAVIGLLASIVLVYLQGSREKARIARGLQFDSSLYHILGADNYGLWKFDEGSGSTAYDSSGYSNHGTINNALYRCAVDDKKNTAGGQGCSLEFGANRRVHTVDMSPYLGDNITFTAWLYRYESGNSYNMFMGQHLPYFAFRDNNRFFFSININGSQRSLSSLSTYSSNQWHHYVATFDGEYMRLYINGREDGSVYRPGSVIYYSSYLFSIGDGRNSSWYPFAGLIDEIRVYNRALKTAEIEQLYARGLEKYKYLTEFND